MRRYRFRSCFTSSINPRQCLFESESHAFKHFFFGTRTIRLVIFVSRLRRILAFQMPSRVEVLRRLSQNLRDLFVTRLAKDRFEDLRILKRCEYFFYRIAKLAQLSCLFQRVISAFMIVSVGRPLLYTSSYIMLPTIKTIIPLGKIQCRRARHRTSILFKELISRSYHAH